MGIINNKKTAIHYEPIKFSEASRNFKNNIAGLSLSLDKELIDNIGVLFCGVESGCGTSSIVCGLAIKESEYKKTLLVDLNFRQPSIANYFSLNKPGLSNYLTENLDISDIINKVNDNLFVITAGTDIENAFEKLSSGYFDQLFNNLTKGYERVIFDCSNLKDCADAVVFGKVVKNIVLVLDAKSRKSDISYAFKALDIANVNVVGMVMNKK